MTAMAITTSTMTPQARNARPVTNPDGDVVPGPACTVGMAVGLGAGVAAGALVGAALAVGATVGGLPGAGFAAAGTGVLTVPDGDEVAASAGTGVEAEV
jgi:hypothetical protein